METRDILTPSQLNTLARDLLEGAFPAIWVEGELGGVARPASGHLYFSLKDERAQVRCAMFKPKSTWLKFQPRDGLRVLARGRLTLYEARGDYQLVLDHMEEAGEGALRRALEELKAKLAAEGLFDAERKRALPAFPRRIGLLTSPSGAVVRDVLSVLARRLPLAEIDVLPVPVQGATAAAQIRGMLARAIQSERYDVLLIARGGGSLEDLWAFNDEQLARAIAASPVPVVSAIGHETDFSLSDFVADLRAPTPSVAAELLVPNRVDLRARLSGLSRTLASAHGNRQRQAAQRADRAWLRLQALHPQARFALLRRREAELKQRMDASLLRALEQRIARLRHAGAVLRGSRPERRLAQLRERLFALRGRPQSAVARQLQHEALRLRGLARSLETVSPLATVARGYAILRREDGRIVRGTGDAPVGSALKATVADGLLKLRVEGDKPL
ncbi:exodeoxyribonuclease VII large subunit [Pseudoluteimonas lycopersici]|uniref:Exodeoxyribonuclease 7 large subunit n=1 Tax=Pseudoluteimonas lycopersici TaxID=1324796 RepID=A0A516V2B1_9GAMM|nr:exodeoxyribonuclease VII large subunit [Lysobacter lycopersici]QDQ72655.1 exodeoxyribonuclease VII large subunit [Lysobacter lycopersici]